MNIYSPERTETKLMRKVAEAASDYVLGKLDSDFADMNGGVDCLYAVMCSHLQRWQEHLSDEPQPAEETDDE